MRKRPGASARWRTHNLDRHGRAILGNQAQILVDQPRVLDRLRVNDLGHIPKLSDPLNLFVALFGARLIPPRPRVMRRLCKQRGLFLILR
jgi:hypothetical protein